MQLEIETEMDCYLIKSKVFLLKTFLLSSVIFIFTSQLFSQPKFIAVQGEIVDTDKKPIKDSLDVFVDIYVPVNYERGTIAQPCIWSPESFPPPERKDRPEVIFECKTDTGLGRGIRLFVFEKVPNNWFLPFDLPSGFSYPTSSTKLVPSFRGIPIILSKKKQKTEIIDVGEVEVQIRYGKVVLDLVEIFGNDYVPSRDSAKNIGIIVREQKSNQIIDLINGNNFVEENRQNLLFDVDYRYITLAMIQGTWNIEVFLNANKSNSRKLLNTTKIGKCSKLSIKDNVISEDACPQIKKS